MAGYSKKTLGEKLGIKEGYTLILLNQPANYGHLFYPFPQNCRVYDELKQKASLIQFFTKDEQELQSIFPKLKEALLPDGSLWISWPKTSAKSKSKLNEKPFAK